MEQLTSKQANLNKWLIICSLSFLTLGILLFIFRKRILTFFGKISGPDPDLPDLKNDNSIIVQFYKQVKSTLPDYDDLSVRYIVAQAMHETGNFTSKLFTEHNNAFGMMYPQIRENVAHSATNTGYAHYNSINDSIRDLDLYFKSMEYPVLSSFPTIKEYAKFLKQKGYYTDTILIYGNALHNHFTALKSILQ